MKKDKQVDLSFRPIESICEKATWAIYANIAAAFMSFPILTWLDRTPTDAKLSDSVAIAQGLGGVGVFVFELGTTIVAGVLFLKWMYRAYVNAKLLTTANPDAQSIKSAGIDVIGGFFIPIVSLFKPYQNMCMLWRSSDVKAGTNHNWEMFNVPNAIGFWWMAFLIGSTADRLVDKMTGDMLVGALVVGTSSRLVAGLIVVRLMRAITERQTHKIHMLQAESRAGS